eukprot:s290_g5.t1
MNFGDERDEIWRRMSWLSPLAIRFTHAEISAAFQNGSGLDATIEKFCRNELSAEHFKDAPLEVVWKDGFLWSLNNRRLYVFRVAHALGCCSVCPCYITPRDLPTVDRVTNRWMDALTSTTNGKLVNVRGGSQYQDLQLGHPVNDEAAARLGLPSMDQFMRRKMTVMGFSEQDLKTYQERLEKEGFTSLCSLFDLAYYPPSDMPKLGLPIRLQRSICDLLASPEPFDFVNRDGGGQAPQLDISEPPSYNFSGWGERANWTEPASWNGSASWSEHASWVAPQVGSGQWHSAAAWENAPTQQSWCQTREQQAGWEQPWQQCQQWQQWQWQSWQSEQPNTTVSQVKTVQPSDWLDQGGASQPMQVDPTQADARDESKQREYVESFCRRRELTRPARRDLFSLDTSAAYDMVYSLEVDKKGLSLKPDEWSRILSSRVAAKATSGELDQTSIQQIDSLMKVVMRAAILSQEAISELRSTLRNLAPSELEDILRDSNFTERVPYGSITNPAAYVHRMAVQTRRHQVEKSIPDFVARWRYSRTTEGALRDLCRVNPSRTKRLMEVHKASRGEASLLKDIQAVEVQGRGYVSRTFRSAHAENHKQLESEWSDEEVPAAPAAPAAAGSPGSEAWSSWMPSQARATPQKNDMEPGQASQSRSSWEVPENLGGLPESEAAGVGASPPEAEEPQEPIPDDDSDTSEESDVLGELPALENVSTVVVTAPTPPRTQLAAHYVIVLDISGSMSNRDCVRQDGSVQERIQAVKEHLSLLTRDIEKGQQKHLPDTASSDVYSAVTFNSKHYVLFSLETASAAAEMLQRYPIYPEGQTYYTSGLEGIEICVQRAERCPETQGRPTYVLFFSDGDPWDPPEFLAKLTCLMKSSNKIQINTVAFGHSADSALDFRCHLKQLADVGGGICTQASTSVASLRGAFRAVRSTITTSRRRDSLQASSGRLASSSGPADAHRKVQRVEVRDERGRWHAAHVIKLNQDRTVEVEVPGQQGSMSVPYARIWWPSSQGSSSPLELESADPRSFLTSADVWSGWEQGKRAWRRQYRFDGKRFQIGEVEETTVWRRVKYFTKGTMRIVRFMCDQGMGWDRWLVCKHLLAPSRTPNASLEIQACTKADMEPFCRNSAVARHYAKCFRQRSGECLGFRQDYLYQLQDEPGSTQVFMGELHMKGDFVKFNNNGGSVNKAEHLAHCEIAQAFSHFTFDESHRELLVVDIQGVPAVDEKTGGIKLHLTDPQVHCRYGNYESFGDGDLKEEGVRKFFSTHVCNHLCRRMKLRPVSEYDFIPPKAVVQFPGVSEGFLRKLTAETLKTVRAKYGLAEVVFPNSIIGPVLEAKLWGRTRDTSRAKEAIEQSVERLLKEHCYWVPLTMDVDQVALKNCLAQLDGVQTFLWPGMWPRYVLVHPVKAGPEVEHMLPNQIFPSDLDGFQLV